MYDYFPIKQISDGNYYSERKRNGPNPLAESRIHPYDRPFGNLESDSQGLQAYLPV
jgi:hypothetical protein